MVILRLPSITAPDNAGKIEQIRSYLYSTIKDINFAFNNLEVSGSSSQATVMDGETIFSLVKPLIIKSSDILNTYYQIIKERLDEEYAPQQMEGSILEYAEYCEEGTYRFVTDSDTEDMPEGYEVCVGHIYKYGYNTLIQMTDIATGNIASNTYSGDWDGWKYIEPQ